MISYADVAELVDAPDLGSGSARSEGSSPFIRIIFLILIFILKLCALKEPKFLLRATLRAALNKNFDHTHLQSAINVGFESGLSGVEAHSQTAVSH